MKKAAEKHCLDFARKYPSEWHSFSQDQDTTAVVRNLELKNNDFEVDWLTKQFRFFPERNR